MSKKVVDIGTQSTAEKLVDKIGNTVGISCFPKESEFTGGNTFSVGAITYGERSTVSINYKGKLYVLPDETQHFYIMTNDANCWDLSVKAPYPIDIHESCILVYENPVSEKTEIHILGGYGYKARSHYKWDGETWTIASELPYDFCAGKAIVFNNEIHIFGGGPNHYQPFYQDGFLNYHYKWDGAGWEKVSEPPFNLCGATPVVCDRSIRMVGGCSEDTFRTVYKYTPSGGWTKMDNIPDKCPGVINPSIAVYKSVIRVIGGVDTSGNRVITHITYTTNTGWENGEPIPEDALCDSSNGLTLISDKLWLTGYRAYYLTSNNNWVDYQGLYYPINGGIVVTLDGITGKRLALFSGRRVTPIGDFSEINMNLTLPCDVTNGAVVKTPNGDIHIVSDTGSNNVHYHYERTIASEDLVKYERSEDDEESLPIHMTNISVAYYNDNLHVIGAREHGYNHYILTDTGWVPILSVPFDTNNFKLITINGDLYAVIVTNESISNEINLYKFTGVQWNFVCTYSGIGATIDAFSVVEFKNRLHVIFIDNTSRLRYLVFVGEDFIEYKGVESADFLEVSAVPYNGYIHIFASDDAITEHYCMGYALSGDKVLEIYLPKGHQLLCNKNDFLPIVGIVEETGYVSTDSGIYRFVITSDTEPTYSIA